MRHQLRLAALVSIALTACVLPAKQTPHVDLELGVASQYNHRGMVENANGVVQGQVDVGLATKDGGSLDLVAWGNADMTTDPGDAWFPKGNQGRFSEIDFKAIYSREFQGTDVSIGVVNYDVPKGDQFPNGERGETNELFISVSREFHTLVPEFVLHYDFDEAKDFYLEAACSRSFEINDKFGAEVRVNLGWSGRDESFWNYGLPQQGFADLGAKATLAYFYDPQTTIRAFLAGSTIVDGTLRDWFDLIGVEKNNLWAGVGVTWSF